MAGTVSYMYPNGGKAPTQAQMLKANKVHAQVTVPDNGSVDLTHNFQFDPELPAEALQLPLVVANAVTANGGVPHVSHPDGNTLRLSSGDVGGVYDVWVMRHEGSAAPKG
jgi:hypothetical protein